MKLLNNKSSFLLNNVGNGGERDSLNACYFPVWIPFDWNDNSSYEKCEILVSNLVYPIQQFFSNVSRDELKQPTVKKLTSSMKSKVELIKKCEEIDSFFVTTEEEKEKKKKQKKSSSTNFPLWKDRIQLLLINTRLFLFKSKKVNHC
jgi:hypothetical protein